MKKLIDKLNKDKKLNIEEWEKLVTLPFDEDIEYARGLASEIARENFGNKIYIRGLIEISNYCKNNCYYCGIRRDNKNVRRYRLKKEQILACCEEGDRLGFRTFVLQGGEDSHFTDEVLEDIISGIKEKYPDCRVTLSLGERSKESYKRLFDAGADRYLLRHETADCEHYGILHPKEMSFENRMECLKNLKEIGYQTGCGFMVGSPGQTQKTLAKDMQFISQFKPQMVGIGPYVSHHDTPFRNKKSGSLELTLYLLSLVRIIHPTVLLPATTALGAISDDGRERAILSGANVVMPNLSPMEMRGDYTLYDNKPFINSEAAEGLKELELRLGKIGYEIDYSTGDYK